MILKLLSIVSVLVAMTACKSETFKGSLTTLEKIDLKTKENNYAIPAKTWDTTVSFDANNNLKISFKTSKGDIVADFKAMDVAVDADGVFKIPGKKSKQSFDISGRRTITTKVTSASSPIGQCIIKYKPGPVECNDVYTPGYCVSIPNCTTIPGTSPTCSSVQECGYVGGSSPTCYTEQDCNYVSGTSPTCQSVQECGYTSGTPPTCQTATECGTSETGEYMCKDREVCSGGSSGEYVCKDREVCSGGTSGGYVCTDKQVCSSGSQGQYVCQDREVCSGGSSSSESCSYTSECEPGTTNEVCAPTQIPVYGVGSTTTETTVTTAVLELTLFKKGSSREIGKYSGNYSNSKVTNSASTCKPK